MLEVIVAGASYYGGTMTDYKKQNKDTLQSDENEIRTCITNVAEFSAILGKPSNNVELAVVFLMEWRNKILSLQVERNKELELKVAGMKKDASEMLDMLGDKAEQNKRLIYALSWAFKAGDFENIAWDNDDQKMYDFARKVRGK